MKQLLILSGKGGTGKTTVASAFIKLTNAKTFADCDVDAPNLHLLMGQDSGGEKSDYYGMDKAVINLDKCNTCGLCGQHCNFDAIKIDSGKFKVDYYACEGCGVCEWVCPTEAIQLKADIAGKLMLYKDEIIFSTAKLKMGSGTSGKLVTEVKKHMEESALDTKVAIIDGSPGIGCPVIASISGVDMVLIVVEPSLSGISDMERIINTARKFDVETAICINKYDISREKTKEIELICKDQKLSFVGKIPFDPEVVKAVNNGQSIADIHCPAGIAIEEVVKNTMKKLIV